MNPWFDFKCVVGVSVIVFDFNYIKYLNGVEKDCVIKQKKKKKI
jgi:hypothetical protein